MKDTILIFSNIKWKTDQVNQSLWKSIVLTSEECGFDTIEFECENSRNTKNHCITDFRSNITRYLSLIVLFPKLSKSQIVKIVEFANEYRIPLCLLFSPKNKINEKLNSVRVWIERIKGANLNLVIDKYKDFLLLLKSIKKAVAKDLDNINKDSNRDIGFKRKKSKTYTFR